MSLPPIAQYIILSSSSLHAAITLLHKPEARASIIEFFRQQFPAVVPSDPEDAYQRGFTALLAMLISHYMPNGAVQENQVVLPEANRLLLEGQRLQAQNNNHVIESMQCIVGGIQRLDVKVGAVYSKLCDIEDAMRTIGNLSATPTSSTLNWNAIGRLETSSPLVSPSGEDTLCTFAPAMPAEPNSPFERIPVADRPSPVLGRARVFEEGVLAARDSSVASKRAHAFAPKAFPPFTPTHTPKKVLKKERMSSYPALSVAPQPKKRAISARSPPREKSAPGIISRMSDVVTSSLGLGQKKTKLSKSEKGATSADLESIDQ